MSTDARQAAAAAISRLITLLKASPSWSAQTVAECEALERAVAAFHMEGIRFRMYNVDRQFSRSGADAPPGAPALLEEVRQHLEAAGFHTRSHQAPG